MDELIKRRELNGKSTNELPSSAFLNLVSYYPYKEDSPPLSCCFNPDYRYSNIFAICNENGQVKCGDTNLARRKVKNLGAVEAQSIIRKGFEAVENAAFDCQWQPSYMDNLLVASGDGTIALWNVDERKKIASFSGHMRSVKCLSVCPDEPYIFASGSRDGSVMLWDTREAIKVEGSKSIGPVRIIRNAHLGPIPAASTPKRGRGANGKPMAKRSASVENAPAITAVLLHDRCSVISGGTKSSGIRFWDLRKIYSTKSLLPPTPYRKFPAPRGPKQGAGFTSFSTSPVGRHTLYVSCTDCTIYAYSLTGPSTEPRRSYSGADISSFYVRTAICPYAPYLLCGTDENCALIWSLDSKYPNYILGGHSEDVCAVAWNDRFEILTFGDTSWRLWTIDPNAKDDSSMGGFVTHCQSYDAEIIQNASKFSSDLSFD